MVKDINTEQKILEAARKVFVRKGMAGARMQEIADEAGINKAMLHYYYRNKEKLFEAIFLEAFAKIAPRLQDIIGSEDDLFTKIGRFVDQYISTVMANPYLPVFVIHEMSQDPEKFMAQLKQNPNKPDPSVFLAQINAEVKAGRIRPVNPFQLLLNIISLCLFPFVARPMFQTITGVGPGDFDRLMEERKKHVTEFIINSIKT
jgi:TetR/AcrR family transcriptional regulator